MSVINLVKSNTLSIEDKSTGASKANGINVTLHTENHAFGLTPAFTRFSPDYFQIVDTGDMDRGEIPAVQDYLDNIINNGIQDGSRRYIPVFAGSSNQRNGQFVMCWDKIWNDVTSWCCAGLDCSKLPVGKLAKYMALMFSTVRSWDTVFPDNSLYGIFKYPHPSTWGVFSDVDVNAVGLFNKVTPWAVTKELVLSSDKETNKITDGIALFVLDDTQLNSHQKKELIKKAEAFTVRAPMVKGLFVPILKSALIKWFEDHPEASSIQKDAWGNEQNLLDLQVITFKSVFKAWKCVKQWSEYVEGFDAYEHRVWVCVAAHGERWASLPYQQLQTLNANNAQIEELARTSASFLIDNAKIGKLGKIIGGNLGKIVDVFPDMLHDPFVREQLQRKWISRCKQMYGGRILHVSHNLFCSSDIVAVLEGLTGQPVHGVLPANTVHTQAFGYDRKLGCTRCPHLDNAWVTPRNIKVPEEYLGLYMGTTIFYSCNDSTMKVHQMDFDGDHSNVTDNPLLIKLAEYSHASYDDSCLLYAAMDDGTAPKTTSDYKTEFNELCRNSFKAPIGLYANTLTKVWALRNMMEKTSAQAKNLWVWIACLTRKGNTCIDEAGGHGKDSSVGIAEDVVEQFRRTKKPWFHGYAKGTINPQGQIVRADADYKYEFKPFHTVDVYSAICRMLVPTEAETVIDLSTYSTVYSREVATRIVRTLMKDSNVRTRRAAMKDLSDTFADLVCAANHEEVLIAQSSSLAAVPNFTMDKVELIRAKCEQIALNCGYTLDDAVDILVFNLFYKTSASSAKTSMMKRWFFITFGDIVFENAQHNLSVELTTTDNYEDASEEEDDAIDQFED